MYNSKGKTQKAYKLNKAEQNIIPKNCVAVFPMLIVSGSTYITENGTMPQNLTYDKGSFLFWQEVFDGRKAIKIQWDGAITLEKPLEKNYYLANTQVGKYYYGKPISNSTESLDIGEDASFDEFITMKSNQTITLRFEFDKSNRIMYDNLKEDLRFVDNDLYKLYLIPEICEGKLMYISDYEEIYNDETGLSWACEITFQTLGNELQKSGKAVEQYPRWSAPGEFYVKPKIEYSVGDKQVKRVVIDRMGLNPKPIKYLQVELQGPALTSCVYALGRRQEKDPTTGKWKIGPSHHLLGYQFVSNQPNPLNRTSTPTKNYDCFHNEEVCFATNADFLALMTDKISQPLEQMKNGGLVSLGHNINDWKNVANGIHKSNDPEKNTVNVRFDYYDENWKPLSYLGENFSVNTNGCVYAEDTMEYKVETDRMIDIMNKNVFTFNQQPIIPLSMYATRPFYLRNIPIIGAIANFFSLGDIHLFNNTTNREASNLIFFGDADLMAICANLQQGMIQQSWKPFKTDGKVAFPINFFGNNEAQYNKLGVNSVNTTFCIELTDQVVIDGNEYNTILLGQNTYEDGTPIFPDNPEKSLLVNGSLGVVNPYYGGYIIDAVIVQSIFDGKIRISCYSTEDNQLLIPEWTTTILSNANWQGGAMRDWTNMFLLSNWEERFCRQQDEFTYPLAPHKPSTEFGIVNCYIKQDFDSGMYGNGLSLQQYHPKRVSNTGEWSQFLGTYKDMEDTNHIVRSADFTQARKTYYTELGIAEITDADSFIEYFENIQLDTQQTSMTLFWYDFNEPDEDKRIKPITTNTWNIEYQYIGSLVEDEYDYYFECPIVSFNNSLESWKNEELSDTNKKWLYSYAGTNESPSYVYDRYTYSGCSAKMTIHIHLANDGIEVSAVDSSVIPTWQNIQKLTSENYLWLGTINDGTKRAGQLKYNLNLNKLRFVKRGNGTTFSNKIYGKK